MSFAVFLDEMIPVGFGEMLTSLGYDALSARDAARSNRGISDEDQLSFAASPNRVLVTFNVKDFFPLAQQWALEGRPHAGIIGSEELRAWELLPRMLRLFEQYPDGFPENLCLRLPTYR